MVIFKKTLIASLGDYPDPFGKPYGARLALVCPHPETHDPLALGLREGARDRPILGLDGGEGYSLAMDLGAAVWWVVEVRASELPLPMHGTAHAGQGGVAISTVNGMLASTGGEGIAIH